MKDDLISRKAAIDVINRAVTKEAARWSVEDLPSAQPAQKKGQWLMRPDPYGFFEDIPVCSECSRTTKLREKYPYCPNCGAKMEEEVEQ